MVTKLNEEKTTLEKSATEKHLRLIEQAADEVIIRDITERKRAQEALQQSEENLKTYLESAPDGVYLSDLKGKFLYGNKKAEGIMGYKREELIGKGFLKLNILPKKHLVKAGKLLALNAIGRPTGPDEFELIRKDGSRVWVEINTTPIKQGGKVVVIGFVRDITERKQAEAKLRESDERYRAIFESTSDMLVLIDRKGKILDVNENIAQISEYEREEIVGKNIRSLTKMMTKKSLAIIAKNFLKRMAGMNIPPYEIQMIKKNGELTSVEINAVALRKDGRIVGDLAIIKDITERKQAEEALQESEEKYRHLFDNLNDAAFLADVETGLIVETNQQAMVMLGRSRDEIVGMHQSELHPPGQADKYRQKFATHIQKGHAADCDGEVIKKDGTIVAVAISASPVTIHGHHLILGLFKDITERKQAEEKEKQLQQQLSLASRLASIGQMASGIAHEINNPLTSVIGFSQLLMRRDIPDDIKEDLEAINSEAQRVAKIVQGLLTFARQHKPGRDYVDINNIVSQVLELRSHHMEVNNIQLLTQLASDLPRTMADANQLQQVFLNIVINAEKEMIKAHGRGKLSVKTEKMGDSIRLSFTDDGPGISKENLDRVFDPFFTTREVGNGTGLGLSICHGIVTAHNGRIYAESELGKGATFAVELPVVAAAEQTEETKAIEEELWQRSGAKILVVDDEMAILDFLKRLLTEQGYQVETINRAHLALAKLQSEKYDLILLDIKLPGMSGIDLYYEIKTIDPAMAQRVTFITGDVMETTTKDFLEKTRTCHIAKPLNIEQLKKNVNDILAGGLVRQ